MHRRSDTLALFFVLVRSTAGAGQDAMFRGGPTHEGVYRSPSPTLGTLVWKFKTKGRVLSSPAVSGDRVYVGSSDGRLYAIDRASGAERWQFASKGPIASSPAVHGDLVYISSVDGMVYAVNGTARDGARNALPASTAPARPEVELRRAGAVFLV